MFEGAYTAIVTPFTKDNQVDYGKLKELIELQIEGGMDGIVPVGTTTRAKFSSRFVLGEASAVAISCATSPGGSSLGPSSD